MKAWIMFNQHGEPEFIDGSVSESEFKSWYRKYLDRGWKAELCEVVPLAPVAVTIVGKFESGATAEKGKKP